MPVKDCAKKERAFSDGRFDITTETAIMRLNDNKVVTVITNFKDVKTKLIVISRTKSEVH